MFEFDQYLGFLSFLTILTIGFWLMIFLLTFVIPYWLIGAIREYQTLAVGSQKLCGCPSQSEAFARLWDTWRGLGATGSLFGLAGARAWYLSWRCGRPLHRFRRCARAGRTTNQNHPVSAAWWWNLRSLPTTRDACCQRGRLT